VKLKPTTLWNASLAAIAAMTQAPTRTAAPSVDDLVRSLYPPEDNPKPRTPWASDEEKIRRAKEKRERKRNARMLGMLKLATPYLPELCWQCCGRREVQCFESEVNPTGYRPCPECKGAGYGESLETMWKRKGITPFTINRADGGGR